VPFSRNPLYAGLNSLQRILYRQRVVMLTGRRATDGREPRQVRKEAAISDAVCVVERSRSVHESCGTERNSIKGAQPSPVFSQFRPSDKPVFFRSRFFFIRFFLPGVKNLLPFHVASYPEFNLGFCACDFQFSQSSIFSIALTLLHTELFFFQQRVLYEIQKSFVPNKPEQSADRKNSLFSRSADNQRTGKTKGKIFGNDR